MTQHVLSLPRDPMMFRDGRPFDVGSGARSVPFPLPSTVAGTLRTRSWPNDDFTGAGPRLLGIEHKGPFLVSESEPEKWELAFPAPLDAAVYDQAQGAWAIFPLGPREYTAGSGSDLPKLGSDGTQ